MKDDDLLTDSLKVSIITVVRNGATTIADCLTSVRSQTIPSEHIIIDGCSNDSTLEIVRRISPNACIISEPDDSIYDAMNKGIALARGDIIGILNSDDFFSNNMVLERVVTAFENTNLDSCYGDLVYIAKRKTKNRNRLPVNNEPQFSVLNSRDFRIVRYWKSGVYNPNKFYFGWMPPHPTFFVRRQVYERLGVFNLSLGTAADYEIMLRFLLKHGISTLYIPHILVQMRTGGASNLSLINRLKANHMDRMAWEINKLKPYPWTLYFKPLSKLNQYFRRPDGHD